MSAVDFCKTMENELVAWKAAIYDIVRKIDKKSSEAKEQLLENIEDLHILVEELDQRIEQVRSTCSLETGIDDIKTERDSYEKAMTDVRLKVEDAMRVVSGGDFGG